MVRHVTFPLVMPGILISTTLAFILSWNGFLFPFLDRGGGGRIINIGSQAGTVGIEERAAYCASKGGVGLLTKALAIELAPHAITVNAVAPTFVDTELTRATLNDPEWRERVLSRIPLGHVAEVQDVAAAVLYLASPAARMVTGHSLLVDGGWTAW